VAAAKGLVTISETRPMREVRRGARAPGGGVHAGVGEGFGGDSGACGYVQHFLAGVRIDGCDRLLAPVDVLAEGEDAVHEVVAFGYGIEHGGDVAGFLV